MNRTPSKPWLLSWHRSCLQECIWFHTFLHISQIYKTKEVVKQVHWLFWGCGALTTNIHGHTNMQFTVIYLLNLPSTCGLLRSKHWLMFNSSHCLAGAYGVADAFIKVALTFQTIGVKKSGNVSVSECIFLWRKAISAELTAQWATNWSRCRILAILFLI